MEVNDFPLFADGEFGFSAFHSIGSWPEIDLFGTPSSHFSDSGATSPNWESDWIDIGGEG
jgi:hypothetical protein